MFIEEARVGAELAHPNIVQVYDFCADAQGSYYIVMEWVEGMDLGSLVKAYREHGEHMPWPLVVAAGIGTLRGLGAAHERRRPDGTPAPIVHRDVSPHNILVGMNGIAKLTDFGLARARDRVFSLTAPGTVKGKLSYLSPEVAMGGQATPLSDLFAMGAVLWESLTGERLFDGRSDLEVFKQIRQCLVRPLGPRRPDVPPALVAVINGALTKDPERRFGSAAAVAFMLAEVLKLAPPGVDPQAALGTAVADVRARLGVRRNPLDADHVPTWKWQAPPPAGPHLPAAVAAGTEPGPEGTRGPGEGAVSPARALAERGVVETTTTVDHEAEAVDIEFSKPDLTVEPLPLTKRKD
jgi:serine/threonine-protein kinase